MPGSFSCSPPGPVLVFSVPHSVHTQVCVVSSGSAVMLAMVRLRAFRARGAVWGVCVDVFRAQVVGSGLALPPRVH